MATTARPLPKPATHPARRLDLLVDGSGLHAYLDVNREFRITNSPYLDEAADILWDNLKNVPGDRARKGLIGLDHRHAIKQLCKHLRSAAAYDESSATHLSAAWSVFVGAYGDPGAPAPRGKFNPNK